MTRFPRDCVKNLTIFILFVLGGFDLLFASYTLADQEKKENGDTKISVRTSRRRMSSMSLQDIRASLKKNPKDALLYYQAGLLEEKKGNLVQALRDYQEAISLKARVADAYYRTGIIWEKTGEFYDLKSIKTRVVEGAQRRKAIDAYRAAIRARPDFADAYYRLSLVYLVGEDMREANETFQKLQQVEPQTDRTRQLLLMIYKRHQQSSRPRR